MLSLVYFLYLPRAESSVGTTVTRLGGSLVAAALIILAVGLVKTV